MKRFKSRISKFGSLVSLIALSAMIVLFAVNFPVFTETNAGKLFAGIWTGFALIMFVAHAAHLMAEHQHQAVIVLPGAKKDARTRKAFRGMRAMRG